jgi:hypothetical protein
VQTIGQQATNEQRANSGAVAHTASGNALNPVAVLSPGSGGTASQQNDASSRSAAGNENRATQAAGQEQTGAAAGCIAGDTGQQAVGQSAANTQAANSDALALQSGATNVSNPVQVLSPGAGGAVSQANNVAASSSAQNLNEAIQAAAQTQVGAGAGLQTIGQTAQNAQAAASAAIALLEGVSSPTPAG